MEDTEEEWELYNDNGFVYNRKKRRITDPSTTKPSAPDTDPEAEERNRREHKRKTLLKLKKQYQKEINQWELLSNTLRAMQEKSISFQQQQHPQQEDSLMEIDETPSVLGCGSLVDELILQADTQEAIIRDVSNLCDVAEAICNAQEEQLKQSYFDLPIWASPRDLMASLCDE